MQRISRGDAPVVVFLDHLMLLAMLLALAGILTAAMVLQVAMGEIPCPLCLLQRVAMFGCCFGLVWQLRAGERERGAGIAMVFALLLLVIAARQTLLDIVPRPGHAYIGQAVFGIHMPVWSVAIAVALLAGFAVRLALFGAPRAGTDGAASLVRGSARVLELYLVALCAVNFVAVVLQCGVGECHTTGYRLLP
jgi:disulfide bond formation protein DsbB